MTAKEMLERNGSFRHSDLIDTARRLHGLCVRLGAPYAIVGGLAVVRNGAPRTTVDVDVLFAGDDWGMVLPGELDEELGARFIGFFLQKTRLSMTATRRSAPSWRASRAP